MTVKIKLVVQVSKTCLLTSKINTDFQFPFQRCSAVYHQTDAFERGRKNGRKNYEKKERY